MGLSITKGSLPFAAVFTAIRSEFKASGLSPGCFYIFAKIPTSSFMCSIAIAIWRFLFTPIMSPDTSMDTSLAAPAWLSDSI